MIGKPLMLENNLSLRPLVARDGNEPVFQIFDDVRALDLREVTSPH